MSTCRFAQRVARVQNDAKLNEEVDPVIMIRQLKAQVAALQEELAIAKGDVAEGDELKDYERDKLRQRCVEFVQDGEPTAHLNMGEFTYTKMRECFAILKSMATGGGGGGGTAGDGGGGGGGGGTVVSGGGGGGGNQELEQRVAELEQLVLQRDNEIAIMVNMLRNGKGEVPESVASRGGNQGQKSMPSVGKSAAPPPSDANFASTFQVDPAVLEDPAKAFEAFKAKYPKNDAIRDNKVALKKKYDAAKELATRVNDARNQIKTLTGQMDKLRKQQAMADEGLTGDSGGGNSADMEEAEKRLKDEVERHKAAYKQGFGELSELKKEIQHIQKMLEMGRLKLQKDFDLWYQRQGKGALLTEALVAQPKDSGAGSTRPPSATVAKASKSSPSPRDPATLPVKSVSPARPPSASAKSALTDDVRKSRSSQAAAPTASVAR